MHPKFRERKLEFYREAYERQLERREHALERLSQIVTIHTLVGGLIAYYASGISELSTEVSFLLFFIPASIGTVIYIVGLFMLVLTLHNGTTLHVLPPPAKYDSAFSDAEKDLSGSTEDDEALVSAFDDGLVEQYRDLATFNQAASNIRDSKYSRISRLGVWSLLWLILGAPAFFVLQKQDSPKPTEVIITKPISLMTTPTSKPTSPAPANQTTQTTQSAPVTAPNTQPTVKINMPKPEPLNESFGARKEDIHTMEQKKKSE